MTIQDERHQLRRQQSFEQNPWRVLTIADWCELNNFSLPTGRRIIKSGNGPVITQLSPRRIGITIGANADWQAHRPVLRNGPPVHPKIRGLARDLAPSGACGSPAWSPRQIGCRVPALVSESARSRLFSVLRDNRHRRRHHPSRRHAVHFEADGARPPSAAATRTKDQLLFPPGGGTLPPG